MLGGKFPNTKGMLGGNLGDAGWKLYEEVRKHPKYLKWAFANNIYYNNNASRNQVVPFIHWDTFQHTRFSCEFLQMLQLIPKHPIDIKKLKERCNDIYALTFKMDLRCSRRPDKKNDNIFYLKTSSNISFTFIRCNCLKSGSVCALYRLFVIIRRARFCSFDMRCHSKPQFVIPNCRCERMNETYINFMAEMGKYRFSLFITPNVRDILLAIFCVCEFQFINSFTVNPRKLNSVTCSIRVLFIMRRGISFSVKILWR